MYVADSGDGKQTSGNSTVGDGGLQKWVNSQPDGSGTWTLEYTLAAGLGLVANTSASGTTGLEGLTGEVINGNVELFVTNCTIGDLDQTYLFGIADALGFATSSQASGESFTTLATAPADSSSRASLLRRRPVTTVAIAGLA